MPWTGWPALSPLSGVKLPFPGDLLPPIMHFGSDDNPPTAHGNSALPSVPSVVVSLAGRELRYPGESNTTATGRGRCLSALILQMGPHHV